MYFDNLNRIREISLKTNCAVFVLPAELNVSIPRLLVLKPEEKTVITAEQVRDLISDVSKKQLDDLFIMIRPADKLSDVAANAFLKNLEEPQDKVHYLLVTDSPSKLLPTILSRAQLYFWRERISDDILCDEKDKALAKKLITAKGSDLVFLADEITAKKNGTRADALKIVGLAIEMLYKSYFITEKDVFIKKLPLFLRLYDNLEQNGHIKLHLIADLC